MFRLITRGVHPLHHTCLDLYTCLASSCRMYARGHQGGPHMPAMHARAALYTLNLANGLKQLLDTGTGALLSFGMFIGHPAIALCSPFCCDAVCKATRTASCMQSSQSVSCPFACTDVQCNSVSINMRRRSVLVVNSSGQSYAVAACRSANCSSQSWVHFSWISAQSSCNVVCERHHCALMLSLHGQVLYTVHCNAR